MANGLKEWERWLQRSKTTLIAAETLLDERLLTDAISRIYYYTVRKVLIGNCSRRIAKSGDVCLDMAIQAEPSSYQNLADSVLRHVLCHQGVIYPRWSHCEKARERPESVRS